MSGEVEHVTEAISSEPRVSSRIAAVAIGDAAFAERVQRLLSASGIDMDIVRVPDYLMALGHLSRHPADAVIGNHDLLDETPQETAEALRSVAPATRLLLVTPREPSGDHDLTTGTGFDACLIEPLTSQALSNAIQNPDITRNGSLSPRPAAIINPQEPAAEPTVSSGTPLQVNTDTAPDQPPSQEPGDIDLVAALMTTGSSMKDLALKMIAARTGAATVSWADASEPEPQGCARVQVVDDGRALGWLCAPAGTTEQQLTPWGPWLGKWLALQARIDQLQNLAYRDDLTGLHNRRYFNRFLTTIIDKATTERMPITLMVFDIDDFKLYNDRYGHLAGDDILREAAKLMRSLVREHDVVARIGGDEFAVIFWDDAGPRRPNSQHPHDVRKAAERFRQALASHQFPKLVDEAPGTLTISGGLAGYPWDGRTPIELIDHADKMALRAKRQGKNAITFGPAPGS